MKVLGNLGVLVALVASVFVSNVFSQTEKLGPVTYTPVKGWKKTVKENIVTFSEIDSAAGRFCTITLYGQAPGAGSAGADFAREWNNLVMKPFAAPASPKTETEIIGDWTATGGGAAVDLNGIPAIAFLTVLSGNGKTVSILGLFNHESYLAKLVAFNTGIEIDKTHVASVPRPPRETAVQPTAMATMNVNALAKEFQDNEVRANQAWIGKRVRVSGIVNTISIVASGHIEMTFKTSITNYNMARCHFNKSQSAGVATLTAHTEGTVEGTVRGLGGGFDNSKTYFLLDDCIVP
jgi:hypothetical protein